MKPVVDCHYISCCLSDGRAICNLETKKRYIIIFSEIVPRQMYKITYLAYLLNNIFVVQKPGKRKMLRHTLTLVLILAFLQILIHRSECRNDLVAYIKTILSFVPYKELLISIYCLTSKEI